MNLCLLLTCATIVRWCQSNQFVSNKFTCREFIVSGTSQQWQLFRTKRLHQLVANTVLLSHFIPPENSALFFILTRPFVRVRLCVSTRSCWSRNKAKYREAPCKLIFKNREKKPKRRAKKSWNLGGKVRRRRSFWCGAEEAAWHHGLFVKRLFFTIHKLPRTPPRVAAGTL